MPRHSHLLTLLAHPNTGAPTTLPDVESATLLLNLQADALAVGDGNPVSTWTNAGTAGGSFTQTGSNRPTWQANSGTPYVEFDGTDDYMTAGAAINTALDNPSAYAVVAIVEYLSPYGVVLAKIDVTLEYVFSGWESNWSHLDADYLIDMNCFDNINTDNNPLSMISTIQAPGSPLAQTWEKVSNAVLHVYSGTTNIDDGGTNVPTGYAQCSTTAPVTLGIESGDSGVENNGYANMHLYGVMFYQINDYTAWNASDRNAVIGWIAAKYGL